jgi:hypothetical protein
MCLDVLDVFSGALQDRIAGRGRVSDEVPLIWK